MNNLEAIQELDITELEEVTGGKHRGKKKNRRTAKANARRKAAAAFTKSERQIRSTWKRVGKLL